MKINIRISMVLLLLVSIFGFQSFAVAIENNGQEPSETNPTTELEATNQQKLEEQKALAKEKFEQAKQKAQESLDKKKEIAKSRSNEQKQKACQNISSVLSEKLESRQNKALEFKTKLDGHLTKITSLVEKNNIQFSEYENLLKKAKKASEDAQAQIDNLVQYQSKIDCSSAQTVPEAVSTFKEALVSTKDSLKTYRQNIKILLSAVKEQAKAEGIL